MKYRSFSTYFWVICRLWNRVRSATIFIKKFSCDIPDFRDRLKIKPGLTGLAQINGGYYITPREKLSLGKKYIKIMSVKNDFLIALRTFGIAAKGKGAR